MRKKILMVALSMLTVVSLCACGKSNNISKIATSTDVESLTDSTESNDLQLCEFGHFSFEAPLTWTFKTGDSFDENDERYCSIKETDLKFIEFMYEDEKTIKEKYEYNKSVYTNEQTPISATYGNYTWTGFQYSDGFGGYGFEAYVKSPDNVTTRISGVGYSFDSSNVQIILESLAIKDDNNEIVTTEEYIPPTTEEIIETATDTDTTTEATTEK